MTEGKLAEIARAKRDQLARRFDGVSLDALRANAAPTRRRMASALAKPGSRFILEIKKGSPSAGAIRPGADPASIARGYAGVADALSVLIDEQFFGGSLADLRAARTGFAGPILAKDFFLDARQVAEARIAGADAVLVMLSLLDDPAAREIMAEAARLGMDALVEVHDEAEMRRANALGAQIIGINNRDLRDFSIDVSTTERLAKLAGGKVLVSESGISSRQDVERLARHVDAFLVGTSLMQARDPAGAARELVFGRVKLCGLNRTQDFQAAAAATYAGLILVPKSPRAVTLGQAFALNGHWPRRVGVFRNSPMREVSDTATMLGLAAVQLHGDEDAAYVRALARRLPVDCEVWKSVSVASARPESFSAADRLVFDRGAGGTGQAFDWTMIQGHARLPVSLVAGGIGPHNARQAAALGTHAIDVGSAVDTRPGVKSTEKIGALFEALRAPSRQEL
ncbi:MAG TPA: bifunctional indole-3-glycerol-phosphate synthase TrpC/phosphoribosylanthranilate isomerase TrpF, partial [Sphingomicrobium sp.]|nr:bifunctional indole-3-glycerol-phosphate synthase TrpC/phosphoribosylanthranilate isomerase TrpF [Sphingomicrobium sp.]